MENKHEKLAISDLDMSYAPIVLGLVSLEGLKSEFTSPKRSEDPNLYKVYDYLLGLDNSAQVYDLFLEEAKKKTFNLAEQVIEGLDPTKVIQSFERACDLFLNKAFFFDFLYKGKKILTLVRRSKLLSRSLPVLACLGLTSQTMTCLESAQKLKKMKEYFNSFKINDSGYHINKTFGLFSDPKPVINVGNEHGRWVNVDFNLDGRIFLCHEFLLGRDCIEILRQFGASSQDWFCYSESIVHDLHMAGMIVKYVVKNGAHAQFKEYCELFGVSEWSTLSKRDYNLLDLGGF